MAGSHGINNLQRIGGILCLDFTNTIGWRGRPVPNEWLTTYTDLVEWGRNVDLLTESDVTALLAQAEQSPEQAAQALESARALRKDLYGIFSALANGKPIPQHALAEINRILPSALAKLQLVVSNDGFQWHWQHEVDVFNTMLAPIVRSAAELLTSSQVLRVKECANSGCNWLFLDTSRNHRRRWCDMRECGNQVKARRHYQRWKRQQPTQQAPQVTTPTR